MQHLTGLRILNTRPLPEGAILDQTLQALGATSISLPLLNIQQLPLPADYIPLHPILDYAIFISPNAVRCFFSVFQQTSLRWNPQLSCITLGRASAKALQSFGIEAITIPAEADSKAVLNLPTLHDVQQKNIALIKGKHGLSTLDEGLSSRGALVHPIEVYERLSTKYSAEYLQSIWQNTKIDIILITSEQALINLLQDSRANPWIINTPFLVISPRLAQKAQELGIKTIHLCQPNDIVPALIQLYQ
ncbi:MAG: uroporphyrinogen-III synthase [Legionellaceae bacterium]|nr:uroporphyrinogen-III synthase [Legionellaceae bacterium]